MRDTVATCMCDNDDDNALRAVAENDEEFTMGPSEKRDRQKRGDNGKSKCENKRCIPSPPSPPPPSPLPFIPSFIKSPWQTLYLRHSCLRTQVSSLRFSLIFHLLLYCIAETTTNRLPPAPATIANNTPTAATRTVDVPQSSNSFLFLHSILIAFEMNWSVKITFFIFYVCSGRTKAAPLRPSVVVGSLFDGNGRLHRRAAYIARWSMQFSLNCVAFGRFDHHSNHDLFNFMSMSSRSALRCVRECFHDRVSHGEHHCGHFFTTKRPMIHGCGGHVSSNTICRRWRQWPVNRMAEGVFFTWTMAESINEYFAGDGLVSKLRIMNRIESHMVACADTLFSIFSCEKWIKIRMCVRNRFAREHISTKNYVVFAIEMHACARGALCIGPLSPLFLTLVHNYGSHTHTRWTRYRNRRTKATCGVE